MQNHCLPAFFTCTTGVLQAHLPFTQNMPNAISVEHNPTSYTNVTEAWFWKATALESTFSFWHQEFQSPFKSTSEVKLWYFEKKTERWKEMSSDDETICQGGC